MSAFGDLFNDLGGEGIEIAGLARGDHALLDDDGGILGNLSSPLIACSHACGAPHANEGETAMLP